MARQVINLSRGVEIRINVEGRRHFIIRGTLKSMQIFGPDYLSEKKDRKKIAVGTTNGVIRTMTLSVCYDKDVLRDVPTLREE